MCRPRLRASGDSRVRLAVTQQNAHARSTPGAAGSRGPSSGSPGRFRTRTSGSRAPSNLAPRLSNAGSLPPQNRGVTSLFGATQQPGGCGLGPQGGVEVRPRRGPRPLTWALSTCPLTMSRKTLGPAAAMAGRPRKPPRFRARLLSGAGVALETDGVARRTRFLKARPSRRRAYVGGGAQAQPAAPPFTGNAGRVHARQGRAWGPGCGSPPTAQSRDTRSPAPPSAERAPDSGLRRRSAGRRRCGSVWRRRRGASPSGRGDAPVGLLGSSSPKRLLNKDGGTSKNT